MANCSSGAWLFACKVSSKTDASRSISWPFCFFAYSRFFFCSGRIVPKTWVLASSAAETLLKQQASPKTFWTQNCCFEGSRAVPEPSGAFRSLPEDMFFSNKNCCFEASSLRYRCHYSPNAGIWGVIHSFDHCLFRQRVVIAIAIHGAQRSGISTRYRSVDFSYRRAF